MGWTGYSERNDEESNGGMVRRNDYVKECEIYGKEDFGCAAGLQW